jgi:beta-galactosidase
VDGAELLGVGSGDPKPTLNYPSCKTWTYGGRAQIILKKTGKKQIKVRVLSESASAEIEI